MATTAQYTASPKIGAGVVTTADTSRTAPTNVTTIFTAGASGSRIDNINLVAIGTTVASMLRIFIHDGTTYRLFIEIPVVANTPSASTPVWSVALDQNLINGLFPLVIPSGYSIRATVNDTQTGSGVTVFVRGGDF